GDRALHEKRWQDAQASYHEALRLARKQEHMKAQALLLGCLGFCHAAGKNFPEGIACFQQALNCFRSLGETRNELKTQLNLSTLFLETDALAEAQVHLGKALDLAETLEDHVFESMALRK